MSLSDAPRDENLVGYLLNAKVCGKEKTTHLRLSGGKAKLLDISIESLLARRAGRPRKATAKRRAVLPPRPFVTPQAMSRRRTRRQMIESRHDTPTVATTPHDSKKARANNAPTAPMKQLTTLPTLAMTSGRDVSGAILMKVALRYMT